MQNIVKKVILIIKRITMDREMLIYPWMEYFGKKVKVVIE